VSLRTSAVYVFTRLASGTLAMLTLTLVVRGLGPERYGRFTLALAMAAVVTQVLFNPLNGTLARFYGEVEIRDALLPLLRRLLLGVGIVLILLAGGVEASGLFPVTGPVLWAAAWMALAQGVFDFSGQYLAAAQQSRRYSVLFLGKAVLACLFVWIIVHRASPENVLMAYALAFCGAVVVSGAATSWLHLFHSVERAHWLIVARFAGPLLLTSLLSYLLAWGDRYLLERLVSLTDLGRYAAVSDLMQQTLGLVFSGLCMAWYPRMVLAWGQTDYAGTLRLYRQYAVLGLTLALPAGFGSAVILPEVIPLLYGSDYVAMSASWIPCVVAAAILAAVKSYYIDLPLLLGKRVWCHALSIGAAAVLSLVMAVLLIPWLGIAGAALGVLSGQVLGIVLSVQYGRVIMVQPLSVGIVWPPLLAACLMAVLILLLPAASSWLAVLAKVLVGGLVYGATLFWSDFEGIRSMGIRRLL